MNEHAGVGSLLSVLIVLVATVVLHQAEHDSRLIADTQNLAQPTATASPSLSSSPKPAPRPGKQDVRAAEPVLISTAATQSAASRSKVSSLPLPLPRLEPILSRPGLATSKTETRAPVAINPPTTVARTASTVIGRGERLIDVAIRVYGSAEATRLLWNANRDRLTSLDAPVAEGWLLRTP